MSLAHSHSGTPQSLQEDYTILSQRGVSQVDILDRQHTDSHSDSRPIRSRGSADTTTECTPLLQPPPLIPKLPADNDIHDAVHAEQTRTFNMFGEELRILTAYSLPIAGSHLAEFSFILATVISIGHVSTLALAAVALASMTSSVTGYSIVHGVSSALDTLLPPAWTSDRPHMVGLWTQRMVLFMSVVLIPIFAIWFNAEPILLALNQDPDVARLATLYLRCASLGLPACAFNCISRRYFQSQGLFYIPMRIALAVAPINMFLNWLFVFPLGLSFPGAPLATALSFNLVSVASIVYGYYYVPRTAWSPITRESLNPASGEVWKGWGMLVKLSIAGIGQTASEWWSWELIGLAASQLGPVSLAAQSVLFMSGATTYQVPFALSIATSVRIGNLLGQGNARRAGVAAGTSVVIAIGIGCIFSIIFLVFRHKWSYLFNNDPEIASLVASILPVVALFQVFDGMAGVVGGIFRARGKQVVGALLNLSAHYIIGVPLALYLAFWRGHALAGLWEGLTVGLVYCSAVGIWSSVYLVDWKAEVVTAKSRVGGNGVREARDE